MDVRRLDPIEQVVADLRRELDDLKSTILRRVSLAGGAGQSPLSRVLLTASQSTPSTSFVNVPGMTYALAASELVAFCFHLTHRSANTAEAVGLAINGPAGPTWVSYAIRLYTTTTSSLWARSTAYDTGVQGTSVLTANTSYEALVYGAVQNGANAGTLALRMKSELGASVTLDEGGFGVFYKP